MSATAPGAEPLQHECSSCRRPIATGLHTPLALVPYLPAVINQEIRVNAPLYNASDGKFIGVNHEAS